jgi:hypothetical protein
LESKGVNLIEVDYSLFELDAQKKLLRNKENDLLVLKGILSEYIR